MDAARQGWMMVVVCAASVSAAGLAQAQELRLKERQANLPDLGSLRMTTDGERLPPLAPGNDLSGRGGCNQVASHTSADFTGGTFAVQAGIVEGETMAVSYTLPADAFPIKIESIEFIWATSNATVQTTTQYSLHVWDGLPPTGTLVPPSPFFSSDTPGALLPIVVGPGTAGVNVQVSIDPGDPDQLFVSNDSGTNTFSVVVRIEEHNDQPDGSGCTSPPDSQRNAFPVTDQTSQGFLGPCDPDFSQLNAPTENWINALTCPSGCPGGWSRFSELPYNLSLLQCCRPHGDWVIRVRWSSVNCQPGVGACCNRDGTCFLGLASDCTSLGGAYQGDGTTCDTVTCPQPEFGACCMPDGTCFEDFDYFCADAGGVFQGDGSTCASVNCAEAPQACCFSATMSCQNATPSVCMSLGGTPQGVGTDCNAGFNCFPTGACCLPDGTCQEGISPDLCSAAGGSYQGDDTTCSGVSCPQPVGACCVTDNCAIVEEALCSAAGGTWLGMGTDCTACAGAACVCEFDADPAQVDVFDLLSYLNVWFPQDPSADIDDVSGVDVFDLLFFLDCWFPASAGQPCP